MQHQLDANAEGYQQTVMVLQALVTGRADGFAVPARMESLTLADDRDACSLDLEATTWFLSAEPENAEPLLIAGHYLADYVLLPEWPQLPLVPGGNFRVIWGVRECCIF